MQHVCLVERVAWQGPRDAALNVGGKGEIFPAHNKVYAAVAIVDNGSQVVGGEIVSTPNDGVGNSVEMEPSCGVAHVKWKVAMTTFPGTGVAGEGVPLCSRARAVIRQTCHP